MDSRKASPERDGSPEDSHAETPEVTALVARAKEGDPEAFTELMRMYERRIISLGVQMGLSRDDAMDACQDSFVKVFKYIRRFETGRSFFKWLYRIALHSVYDQMRRARSAPTVSIEDLEGAQLSRMVDRAASIQERLESVQLADRVRDSLDLLSHRERIVFVLRDLQDLTTEEIGVILSLSQITVRRHCMSARQKLRQALFPRRT